MHESVLLDSIRIHPQLHVAEPLTQHKAMQGLTVQTAIHIVYAFSFLIARITRVMVFAPFQVQPLMVQIPLERPVGGPPPRLLEVTVWEWTGKAIDEGDYAAEWFESALGRPVRLVRYIGM